VQTPRDEAAPFVIGLGGTLAMAGSIAPWAVIHFLPRFLGVELSRGEQVRHVMGIDLTGGVTTMAIGILVAVVGIGALLAGGFLRPAAIIGAIGGLAILGVGAFELARVQDGIRNGPHNPFLRNPGLGALHLHQLIDVSKDYGLFVVVAGGVVALGGSVFLMLRLRRRSV
jgi:hypothetical protein